MKLKKIRKIFKQGYDHVLELIFPKKCVGCGHEGNWFCAECMNQVVLVQAPTCPQCNRLTPKGQYCRGCRSRFSLTGIYIAAHYREGPLKEAIHNFKYNRIKGLVMPLSELMMMRLSAGFPTGDLVLTCVPLHSSRLAERGFNQAELLARELAKNFGIDFYPQMLIRKRKTKPQVEFSGDERRKNIVGAFQAGRDVDKAKNQTVLIVDDISTTGATLNECAKVLRKAGAHQVWGVVIAKG